MVAIIAGNGRSSLSNEDVAGLFERMAGLLEIAGDAGGYRSRAYRQGAAAIRDLPEPLDALVQRDEDLTRVPGIGVAIAGKIGELFATGRVQAYEQLQAGLPQYACLLLEVPGVGPKTARRIIEATGAATFEELEAALAADQPGSGRPRWLSGRRDEPRERILEKLRARKASTGHSAGAKP